MGLDAGQQIFEHRARGVGRFIVAGFLAAWLAGWLAAEVTFLTFAWRGAQALATQWSELSVGGWVVAVALASFGFVWLSLWTVGGVSAGAALLYALAGRERFLSHPRGLLREQWYGPFVRSTVFDVGAISELWIERRGPLFARVRGKKTVVMREGTREQKELVRAALTARCSQRWAPSSALGHRGHGEPPAASWVFALSPDGRPMLTENPRYRRVRGAVLGGVALAIGALAISLWNFGPAGPLVFGALALGLLWLAAQQLFVFERFELLGQKRLRLRHTRWGSEQMEDRVVSCVRLEVEVDGDGDPRFWLALDVGPEVLKLPASGEPLALARIGRRVADDLNVSLRLPDDLTHYIDVVELPPA